MVAIKADKSEVFRSPMAGRPAAFDLYFDEWMMSEPTIFRQMPLSPKFIMPVTLDEVKTRIANVPKEFTSGLEAVILLGGSDKQDKATRGFCYGRYLWSGAIMLHPFPRRMLRMAYERNLRPHEQIEFVRAGANVSENRGRQIVEFSEPALRDFYLRDVLIHEIGHHVDRQSFGKKPTRKEEGFAEWFASEYGFRSKAENANRLVGTKSAAVRCG